MIEAVDPIEYASEERFELDGRVFPNRLIFRYDTERWNFRRLVADFFGTDDLENLHRTGHFNPRRPGKKNSLDVGKALREGVVPTAAPMLHDLIHQVIARFIGPVKSCQPVPMARVNFHGSNAILRFHTDREYGQTPDLINLWLPVTRVWGSNSMYVESASGSCEFEPVEIG
ncbi:MAG TPA: StrG-like protein, partial [Allosphingosinicella sp.]|nr:StrG-like protein [Allosphingosinicella sp.]